MYKKFYYKIIRPTDRHRKSPLILINYSNCSGLLEKNQCRDNNKWHSCIDNVKSLVKRRLETTGLNTIRSIYITKLAITK